MAEDVVLGETYNFTFFDPYTNINYDLGWESWFDYGNIAFAGFSYSNIENTYSFHDNSLNAESFFWNFGDGATSYLQNPTHTYTENGNFVITQSIDNPCFNDITLDTINVLISSTEEIMDQSLVSVYPNPSKGLFEIAVKTDAMHANFSFKVFDTHGKLVDENKYLRNEKPSNYRLDLSSLEHGHYMLKIFLDEKVLNKAIIIQ